MLYLQKARKQPLKPTTAMLRQFILLLLTVITFTLSYSPYGETEHKKDSIHVNNFRPTEDNQYVCTIKAVDDDSYYMTDFSPSDKNGVAHHILLYGCGKPGVEHEKVWACGEMKTNFEKKDKDDKTSSGKEESASLVPGPVCNPMSDQTILFVEAMQAGSYHLPPDVSFKVGRGTQYPFLVIQIHYKDAEMFKKNESLKDNSGIDFGYQTQPTMYAGGVMLLGSGGLIPPNKDSPLGEEYLDIVCPPDSMPRYQNVIPFAYRVHAHYKGVLISGFRIRTSQGRMMAPRFWYGQPPADTPVYSGKEWTLIGSKSPQEEQTFYPVQEMDIRPDDILVARCLYSNPSDHTVRIGATVNDEMCNFYIMYYTEDGNERNGQDVCFSSGLSTWVNKEIILGKIPKWVDELSLKLNKKILDKLLN